ncbi:hypothetical protein BUALT_Bualt01G0131700 [Buddleja alternifolia]|uniref:MRG domain-containing protein n=1 Tax=Buddleja alternifolia TaxID=168488 RepID=A0AAV6YDA2_9LAMI|nr:hypothetical protein BUALT_Bualt01G0131700 [Buddleja alternifolia]
MSSSGAIDSCTPTSGGGCGGSATNILVKDESVDSSPFQVGEIVLAFFGPCLYDAKVQKAEFHKDKWRDGAKGECTSSALYIVNLCWDEWLGIDRLLKKTEENVRKQKELKEKNTKPGRLSQGVRGKKRKCESVEKEECIIPPETSVNIQIPSSLKKQLVDDYECITQLGQLVKLPCSPSVYEILDKYFDYRVKKDDMIVNSVAEIVEGLRRYFDKALPAMLLYKQERQQYEEVIADNISPSSVYGAEHLLRLFVKLPEMLSCINIEMKTLTELQQRLLDILRFLQINESAFFDSNYKKSEEGFVNAVKEEDD